MDASTSTRIGYIYCLTAPSGKRYVGQTRVSVEARVEQHVRAATNPNHHPFRTAIGAAIRKYGFENFKVDTLEECPVDHLNPREGFWIAELNTVAPNGYNLTYGGAASMSEESRRKMSAASLGVPRSEEAKRKVAEGMRRRYAAHPEQLEAARKLSHEARRKPVFAWNEKTGETLTFVSGTACNAHFKKGKMFVFKAIKKQSHRRDGWRFKYVDA